MTGPGEFRTVRANGLDFEVFIAGEGDRLALCLHGFPEHAISWRHQIEPLVNLGYRVWVPNQRGYGNTTRPPNVADYDVARLIEDVAALIDASGAKRVTLIAHDWGGAVAWFFAIRRLRPLEHLVILNMPHPAVFDHCLRSSWRQLLRSWYIAFFQVPVVPEFLLGLDRARAIELIFRATDPARFDDDVVKVYRDQAAQPGALTAMLNWYRAASRGLRAQLDLGVPVIEVPTLMLWGEADVALRKETTYGTEKYVNDLRLNYLPGVSHWTQQDAPERVNELLVEFLR